MNFFKDLVEQEILEMSWSLRAFGFVFAHLLQAYFKKRHGTLEHSLHQVPQV